jgi:hypothetical protein
VANLYAKWRKQVQPPVFREGSSAPSEQLLQVIWQHQRIRRSDLRPTGVRRYSLEKT